MPSMGGTVPGAPGPGKQVFLALPRVTGGRYRVANFVVPVHWPPICAIRSLVLRKLRPGTTLRRCPARPPPREPFQIVATLTSEGQLVRAGNGLNALNSGLPLVFSSS